MAYWIFIVKKIELPVLFVERGIADFFIVQIYHGLHEVVFLMHHTIFSIQTAQQQCTF